MNSAIHNADELIFIQSLRVESEQKVFFADDKKCCE